MPEYRKTHTAGNYLILFLFLLLALPCQPQLSAADNNTEKDISVWMDAFSGYAIGGYDPVSYFTRREAVPGLEEYQYDFRDVYWKFENVGNLEAFKRHPYIYRPQFSGYDPFALAKNRTIQGIPTLWVIHKNKLYFFHNIIHRRLWLDQEDEIIEKATAAWPKLSRKLLRRIELD
ncbi:MAG: YHS domain-containing (seleno)protein [Methyloligellaceae bacterium]